jgi:hypothetical protein
LIILSELHIQEVIMSKRSLGIASLSMWTACSLALLSVLSAAAQATPDWMIGGKNVTSTWTVTLEAEPEPYGSKLEHYVVLLSEAAGTALALQCKDVKVLNETLLSGGVGHGTASITECQTFLNGSRSTACDPVEPINVKHLLLIVLHNGSAYVLVEPTMGSPLTTVVLGEEEECAVGEDFELTGVLWLEDTWGEPESEVFWHLIQEATEPATSLGGMYFGTHSATIDGTANAKLFEAYYFLGAKFSVLAG